MVKVTLKEQVKNQKEIIKGIESEIKSAESEMKKLNKSLDSVNAKLQSQQERLDKVTKEIEEKVTEARKERKQKLIEEMKDNKKKVTEITNQLKKLDTFKTREAGKLVKPQTKLTELLGQQEGEKAVSTSKIEKKAPKTAKVQKNAKVASEKMKIKYAKEDIVLAKNVDPDTPVVRVAHLEKALKKSKNMANKDFLSQLNEGQQAVLHEDNMEIDSHEQEMEV